MPLETIAYDRPKAVAYAEKWAYFRNPEFFDFSDLGGDCTNFASQCLLAGGSVMNFTPTYGWYYHSLQDRSPSWTGVEYLYRFLTQNTGAGPFGREVSVSEVEPGDLVQLRIDRDIFQHTPVITSIRGQTAAVNNLYVAAHSYDCACRPLVSYMVEQVRFIHIEGIRVETPMPPDLAPVQ